ncbi:hypothetical protein F4803DRAFT_536841 [Xylaria telfairii]|nr:hypothetical protein F4803DRAFT_536841 [Xylaria telfairii]
MHIPHKYNSAVNISTTSATSKVSIVMSPIHGCQLLLLPAEIRNLIYQYARVNYITEESFFSPFRGYSYNPLDFPDPPPLLLTCRQIYKEAAPIIFSEVHFGFYQNCGSILIVRRCGPIIPAAVQSLGLCMDACSYEPAVQYLQKLLGQAARPKRLHLFWGPSTIPTMRNDAFQPILMDFLVSLQSLTTLVLSGNYGEDFYEFAKSCLDARVITRTASHRSTLSSKDKEKGLEVLDSLKV